MSRYIALLQAIYESPDDATAMMIADRIRENGSLDLDEEADGDSLDVMQVTDISSSLDPLVQIRQLKQSRNVLIALRMGEAYEIARSLDQLIHALQLKVDVQTAMGTYDYTNFLEVAEAILKRGEYPDE